MGSNRYLLSIDQGTTGTTALVLRVSGTGDINVLAKSNTEFKQYYPQPGWVEHNLDEIWESLKASVTTSLQEAQKVDNVFEAEKIAGIGITNQRETLCVFDKNNSKPICNAIVWQCRRSTEICEELKQKNLEKKFKEKTGLVLDPYFSGTKLTWLLRNNPEVKEALSNGNGAVGTIDTYLIHRLTGGVSHTTEPSNASRTLMFNIKSGSWDQELLDSLDIPSKDILPEVKDSNAAFGKTKDLGFLPNDIPISGVLGDQQAALAGQCCFKKGEAKCTYGTGAFLLMNQGDQVIYSDNGLLTTVAWQLGGKLTYASEGATFIAGAAVQFLRDQLKLIKSASETEALGRKGQAAPDLYFVPALTGLGAPWWDPTVRGAFLGMTRGTSIEDLSKATLEGIAFQVADLLSTMKSDLTISIDSLKVDGGAVANDLLMELQAAFSGVAIDRPTILETTALGAAFFAGLGVGIFDSFDDLKRARVSDKRFPCDTSISSETQIKIDGWQKAVKAVQYFAKDGAYA